MGLYVLNKRQPCFALAAFLLTFLLRSNKVGLQSGHKKKTAYRCLPFSLVARPRIELGTS